MPLRLEVEHDTRYAYAAPVSLAHHLAHLRPLADAHQRLEHHALRIEPEPAQSRHSLDAWGNAQCHFSFVQPHAQLIVRSESRVQVLPRFAGLRPGLSPAWDAVAERLRYVARAPYVPAVEFALPSPYVPRLPALHALGSPLFAPGRPLAEAAMDLMHRVHQSFRYESRSTDIDTPLAQVLQGRRGVCQDFAHVLIGVLRSHGLAARYVSGYLLTRAPAGDANGGMAMVGADASHAWVQLWCPATPGVPRAGASAGLGDDDTWLDLDPTNDCIPASGHVRVAVGRDFGDVTPLRGVIRGGGRHGLTVAVTTRVLGPATAPAQAQVQTQGPGQIQSQSQSQSQSQAPQLLTPGPMENTGS